MSIKNLFKTNIFLSLVIIFCTIAGSGIVAIGNNLLTPTGNALKNGSLDKFILLIVVSTVASIFGGE